MGGERRMKLDYEVNISTAKILRKYGLGEDKAAQRFLAEDVERKCQPYVPMSAGSAAHMVNAARVTADSIIYPGPYAHYQYVGEGMAGRAPKHYTGQECRENLEKDFEVCWRGYAVSFRTGVP